MLLSKSKLSLFGILTILSLIVVACAPTGEVVGETANNDGAESYALEAYDSIMIIAQAIEEAGSTDSNAILDALENITHEGTLGTITFPYGRNNSPADNGVEDKFWHQWPDPAITIIQHQEEGQDSSEAPIVYPSTYQTGEAVLVGQ